MGINILILLIRPIKYSLFSIKRPWILKRKHDPADQRVDANLLSDLSFVWHILLSVEPLDVSEEHTKIARYGKAINPAGNITVSLKSKSSICGPDGLKTFGKDTVKNTKYIYEERKDRFL